MPTKSNSAATRANESGLAAGPGGLRPEALCRGVPHGARGEAVYRTLRAAIQEGRLKPGDRIMEIEAAQWLGVSRTPVREAIRRLESEGMLQYEARNGPVVARLDRQAVMELYIMRETLEGTAARLCARHASDMEIQELIDPVEQERELGAEVEMRPRHNRRFHEAIHCGAHNRYLKKSLAAVNDSMVLLGTPLMLLPHRAKTAAQEHAQIAAAIQRRDPEGSEEAARQHVRAAQRERLKRLLPDSEC